MSTLADWLRDATVRLAGVSDTPRLDAELLAAHALAISREEMILAMPGLVAPEPAEALLARRLAHEPMAYITGMRDFWTLTLKVAPGVLVPRPDSETLIEAAIAHFQRRPPPRRILDLGTGSGALLLAALDVWGEASGVGIDASPVAVEIARQNAQHCGMKARAEIRAGNWAEGLDEAFDLILCNPPYIKERATLPRAVRDHEPASALFAGADGLDEYRRLAGQIGARLAPGGGASSKSASIRRRTPARCSATPAFRSQPAMIWAGGHERLLSRARKHCFLRPVYDFRLVWGAGTTICQFQDRCCLRAERLRERSAPTVLAAF